MAMNWDSHGVMAFPDLIAQLDPLRKAGLAQGPLRELRTAQWLAEGAPFVRPLCLAGLEALLGTEMSKTGHQGRDDVGKSIVYPLVI
jgi:hypothetical protein